MEWISVKDRLPKLDEAVLAKMQGAIPAVCSRGWDSEWWFIGQCRNQRCRTPVTHWMPLPKPPKEDE